MSKRNDYLMRKYGITEDQYLDKLKKQKDSCALCKKHQSNFSYRLHVDHNHKSGKVRGLLCYYCNFRRVGRHDFASAEALYSYMVEYET